MFRFLSLSLLLMLFAACVRNDTPQEVVIKFVENVQKGNISGSKPLVTHDSFTLLKVKETFSDVFGSLHLPQGKVSIVNSELVRPDEALVTYAVSNMTETLVVVRIKGRWVVSLIQSDERLKD